MKNYSDMSDFEINKRVAKLIFGSANIQDDSIKKDGGHYCWDVETEKYVDFAPCSDPSDAWPVIEDMRISVMVSTGNAWMAECETGTYEQTTGVYEYLDENPLRAAMIVFLMMKDTEHEAA